MRAPSTALTASPGQAGQVSRARGAPHWGGLRGDTASISGPPTSDLAPFGRAQSHAVGAGGVRPGETVTGVRNPSVRAEVGAPRQRERRSPETQAPGSPLGWRQGAPRLGDPASRAGGGSLLLHGQDLGGPRATQPPSRRADADCESGQGSGASGFQQQGLLEAEGREAASK